MFWKQTIYWIAWHGFVGWKQQGAFRPVNPQILLLFLHHFTATLFCDLLTTSWSFFQKHIFQCFPTYFMLMSDTAFSLFGRFAAPKFDETCLDVRYPRILQLFLHHFAVTLCCDLLTTSWSFSRNIFSNVFQHISWKCLVQHSVYFERFVARKFDETMYDIPGFYSCFVIILPPLHLNVSNNVQHNLGQFSVPPLCVSHIYRVQIVSNDASTNINRETGLWIYEITVKHTTREFNLVTRLNLQSA